MTDLLSAVMLSAMNASRFRWAVLGAAMLLSACATAPPEAPSGVLDLSGVSDEAAVPVLAEFLLARGYRVRLVDELTFEAGTDTVTARCSPVLQPAGLDRLVMTRRFPARPDVRPAQLEAFAAELNASLNVGVFVAETGTVLFQSHMTFMDFVSEAEIGAFLAWTGQVELAMSRVEAGRGLLVPTAEL